MALACERDYMMTNAMLTLICVALLLILFSVEAKDRYLVATYAKTIIKMTKITAFYREVEVIEVPQGTYSEVTFNGGYVGL
jgi:hypothetical protein